MNLRDILGLKVKGDSTRLPWEAKLHETSKRFRVSETGTFRNVTSQKMETWAETSVETSYMYI